jgi:Suppressor of fused protein (SUFU)
MDIAEYKQLFEGTDASPGWGAIDARLNAVYGEQQPKHWGTMISRRLGGPDPIDGISVFESAAGGCSHFHFCSYGFTELHYEEDAVGRDVSGFGFELTFRLRNTGQTEAELQWVWGLMQNIARYVFESGRGFDQYHWMPANGPICMDSPTDIVGLIFVADPELGTMDTPHGQVQFLQMVGLTTAELDELHANNKTCEEMVEALRANNPLWVTDLDRPSVS